MSMMYTIVKDYINVNDNDNDNDNESDNDNDKMKMIKIFHEDRKTRRHIALD